MHFQNILYIYKQIHCEYSAHPPFYAKVVHYIHAIWNLAFFHLLFLGSVKRAFTSCIMKAVYFRYLFAVSKDAKNESYLGRQLCMEI